MDVIYNFLMSNIYLYICIVAVLLILITILIILCINQHKRKKIKDDFVHAEKLEEELEKVEDNKNSELENILKKMQEDIELKPEDVVKKFEEEQEEKAIISYQELVDNVKSGKIEVVDDEESEINFVENLKLEDSNEPIMEISDKEETVTPDMVKEAIESISSSSIKEEPKKFKQSEFISPIYGVIDNKLEYPTVKKVNNTNIMDIMNTKDYNELTEEIKKQEEFLNALIEFRNNL